MFKENELYLHNLFAGCQTPEAIYEKLLSLGKEQPQLPSSFKTEDHLVKGCQARLYLRTIYKEGLFYFETEADAFISSGLAQTLTLLYRGLEGVEILTHKPTLLEDLGIIRNISPGRSNGLASLDLKIRQEVLQVIVKNS
ncbi:MAG: SufE family protein [Chlamydiae bacterium]|nr:SufE family protein [Chlamydiota bacterium]